MSAALEAPIIIGCISVGTTMAFGIDALRHGKLGLGALQFGLCGFCVAMTIIAIIKATK